eukprot:363727-Chlamydomonas_euryale.AAC.7
MEAPPGAGGGGRPRAVRNADACARAGVRRARTLRCRRAGLDPVLVLPHAGDAVRLGRGWYDAGRWLCSAHPHVPNARFAR